VNVLEEKKFSRPAAIYTTISPSVLSPSHYTICDNASASPGSVDNEIYKLSILGKFSPLIT
jgi:hypothetical protein